MLSYEYTDANGFIVGADVWKADAAFRREQRDFDKLCDALRRRRPAKPVVVRPAPKVRAVKRSCWYCGVHFDHPERKGPAPKFCSNSHRARWARTAPKREAEAAAKARAEFVARRTRGGQAVDLKGQRFGRLRVLEAAHIEETRGSRPWLVRCDCGAECVVLAKRLRAGEAKSCGCLRGQPRRVNQ